jgi:hypothetical protein
MGIGEKIEEPKNQNPNDVGNIVTAAGCLGSGQDQ